MDQWDRDYIDAEVAGYFEFDARDSGDFQFGYVQGQIDYRLGERDGKSAVEFTWDGHDEMEAAQGRGWMVLDGDELKGMLFIHHGDESDIVLSSTSASPRPSRGSTPPSSMAASVASGSSWRSAMTNSHGKPSSTAPAAATPPGRNRARLNPSLPATFASPATATPSTAGTAWAKSSSSRNRRRG